MYISTSNNYKNLYKLLKLARRKWLWEAFQRCNKRRRGWLFGRRRWIQNDYCPWKLPNCSIIFRKTGIQTFKRWTYKIAWKHVGNHWWKNSKDDSVVNGQDWRTWWRLKRLLKLLYIRWDDGESLNLNYKPSFIFNTVIKLKNFLGE